MAKCFDMSPRKLAYAVLEKLGVPRRVLEGWSSYLENLTYYNTIGSAVGQLHTKTRSLPQWDSWSTRALAALLDIWARRMRDVVVTPS